MLHKLGEQARRGARFGEGDRWWAAAIGLAGTIGCAYFLAARLGLALLSEAEGVALFWPASGVAAGALIVLGQGARAGVAIGVVGGTVAANLLGDRSLSAAVAFGLCNAGEAMLTAWLVDRWFPRPFKFDDLYRVWGFLAAAAVGAAAAAVGGAIATCLFHTTAPLLSIWRLWAAADGLGIITTAPLLIGLYHLASERPPRGELIEGVGALAVLAAMSVIVYASPPGSWAAYVPPAVLFPVLLWVTARCRPVFAAAAAFIICGTLVGSTTFEVVGDPATPILLRVPSVQLTMLVAVLCTLILAALFAERRRNETILKETNERLQLALGGAELGVWSVDLATGGFEGDERDRRINGHDPAAPPRTLAEARSFVLPDDLPRLDAAFTAARQTGAACRAEYRVRAAGGSEARWVAVEGTIVRNTAGRPARLLGVTQDITKRKLVEENLRKHEQALRDLLGALPAAIFTTDAEGRLTYYNQGAAELWGAEPELGEDSWRFNCRVYRADGTPLPKEEYPTEIALKEGRATRDLEAILERPDGTRIPIIPYPTPLRDERGKMVGVVTMTVDISERKMAELALAERDAQLALAGKHALVGSYSYEVGSGILQISAGMASAHGFPEGTTQVTAEEWRARIHPDDLAQWDAHRRHSFDKRRREHLTEYRIVRSDGDVRWIEARSLVSYDDRGRARRMVGVHIDVTERKQAEEHKSQLVAELDHRVKNVLAVVTAVASRTQEASSSMADFITALDGRIKSMATTHELLSRRRWQGILLGELVERELAPYAVATNLQVEGPEVVLRAEAGQAMAMVVHELVTNAAKYGALSAQHGRVSVQWKRTGQNGPAGALALDWRETGGPAVAAPSRAGYGTSVIRDLIPYELGGTVNFALAPEGVRCRLEIPARWLSSVDRPRTFPDGLVATPAPHADGTGPIWR